MFVDLRPGSLLGLFVDSLALGLLLRLVGLDDLDFLVAGLLPGAVFPLRLADELTGNLSAFSPACVRTHSPPVLIKKPALTQSVV